MKDINHEKSSAIKDDGVSKYHALTPVLVEDEVYFEALNFAVDNHDVKNIALTGPYGSGKSSIITSFENSKKNQLKFLNISLASFKESSNQASDGDGDDEKRQKQDRLVERSLLQQMLYGDSSNELTYSRFKRITVPNENKVHFESLAIVIWLFVISLAVTNGMFADLIKSNAVWGLICGSIIYSYLIGAPIYFLSKFIKLSHNYSFKKLSLKNVEIEAGEESENSILNRHLDEIIYFFQSTSYDVVVIEDLDRFGSPEVFVKLRELNQLINKSQGTSGNIKFLYALKDDMFVSNTRAKFFDFIIPVIPVINASNSFEKIKGRLKNSSYENQIDNQFLKEVSLYLSDMRLIHNIFNELAVYFQKVKFDNLNITKLLAVIIYKNIYASDFESLHHEQGILFDICALKNYLLLQKKKELTGKRVELEEELSLAEKENLNSVKDLIKIYLYQIKNMMRDVTGVIVQNQIVTISELEETETFEMLAKQTGTIDYHINDQNHPNHRRTTGKTFNKVEAEVCSKSSFFERKKHIENKTVLNKVKIRRQIASSVQEEKALGILPFCEILKSASNALEDLIEENQLHNDKLLKYLLLNGHLDDNYYQYVSLFHAGRLSKKDNEYLISVRSFDIPSYNHQIDNPKELLSELRETDFMKVSILNITLIDYLIENRNTESYRINEVLSYIKSNFSEAEPFLLKYYEESIYSPEFIILICETWPQMIDTALESDKTENHLIQIIKNVDATKIAKYMNDELQLTDYLNKYACNVYYGNLEEESDFEVLNGIDVKVDDISLFSEQTTLQNYLYTNNLYKFTAQNIDYLIDYYTNDSTNKVSLNTSKLSFIFENCDQHLINYIEENISIYVSDILLPNNENINETLETVIYLLNNEEINLELKEEIIQHQSMIFDDINDVPVSLWSSLLVARKVTPTWQNVFSVARSNEELFTEDHLILFNDSYYVNGLSESTSPQISEISEQIFLTIVKSDLISDENYELLINVLPFNIRAFPESLSIEKDLILLKLKKISVNKESFNFAVINDFAIEFIETYEDRILENKEQYSVDTELKKSLLMSNISEENKIKLSFELDANDVQNDAEVLASLATLYANSEIDHIDVDVDILELLPPYAKTNEDSIKLILRYMGMWDESTTLSILSKLPEPYCNIARYGKKPKLDNTHLNAKLAKALFDRRFVSTTPLKGNVIHINTKKGP